jgi:hypothetical protein
LEYSNDFEESNLNISTSFKRVSSPREPPSSRNNEQKLDPARESLAHNLLASQVFDTDIIFLS